MISEITKAQLLALQSADLKDVGKAKPWHVSMAKRNNVWMRWSAPAWAATFWRQRYRRRVSHIPPHANLESVKTYEARTTSIRSSSANTYRVRGV